MIATRPQVPRSFAISISESPDLAFFGLGPGHLREAMAEMAIHMLAQGGDLAYGGDLRPGGFTELLFELVSRYPRPDDTGDAVRVTNYLAWPVHIQMARDALCNLEDRLRGIAEVILIGRDGKRLSMDERQALEPHVPDDRQWAAGLTGMRRSMRTGTDARIVLGGRVEDYKGCMPGIAEEVMLSLRAGQPLFLLGGFGGCARDIAETLGLVDSRVGSRSAWPRRKEFERWTTADMRNGLTPEENHILADTPYMDEILVLVKRAIRRLRNGGSHHLNSGERGDDAT